MMQLNYDEIRLLRELKNSERKAAGNKLDVGLERLVKEGYATTFHPNVSETLYSITSTWDSTELILDARAKPQETLTLRSKFATPRSRHCIPKRLRNCGARGGRTSRTASGRTCARARREACATAASASWFITAMMKASSEPKPRAPCLAASPCSTRVSAG